MATDSLLDDLLDDRPSEKKPSAPSHKRRPTHADSDVEDEDEPNLDARDSQDARYATAEARARGKQAASAASSSCSKAQPLPSSPTSKRE